MGSLVSWLDVSVDEQRRMRELAALFTLRDSRDELGLGLLLTFGGSPRFAEESWCHFRRQARGR